MPRLSSTRILRASMHVDVELASRCAYAALRSGSAGGAADGGDDDLAVRRGDVPDGRDDSIEERALGGREVVGLPIVAGSRSEQRVKDPLPAGVRLDADVLRDRPHGSARGR